MTGYIRADQVTEGMVIDLANPSNDDAQWTVLEAVTRTSTYLFLSPYAPGPRRARGKVTRRLRHDERVWVTGWGVQPEVHLGEEHEPEEPTVFAWHDRYCFGVDLEIWQGPDGCMYVGGTWTTGHYTTTANVLAETVTVGVAESERDQ